MSDTTSGSPARVAYDLMEKIIESEHSINGAKTEWRSQILDLYAECYRAAIGAHAKTT